jgi:hypothetical protein
MYDHEARHNGLMGATVQGVEIDGGLIYLTMDAGMYSATVLVRAPETKWEPRSDYCETCQHFNPLGSLGEPCEHGI